ncbi:histone methyltransferase [Teratosphaeria destructans]|uniref:Histone-lysine N-methyltransferase, H3 lysine-4 specific n=1 Tax=Teratosphaeria destructans TaxID=418781 RepID=A0A9W7SR37_9PEZI|nr:histone methyltransferase [Teratosphaeria destructans]
MSSGGGGGADTLKRKRESRSRPTSPAPQKTPRYANGTFTASRLAHSVSADGSDASQHYRSPDSDEMHQSDSGETLRGIGSASSLTSAASSVFSSNSHAYAHNKSASLANGLTPLTSHSESSPSKLSSPPTSKSAAHMAPNTSNGTLATSPISSSDIPPQKDRPRMLPPPGKVKGYRVVWDPEMDNKLSKEERKRATLRRKDFGTETYEPDPPPDPRLSIAGYIEGHCRAKDRPSKAIWRPAPYNLPPYKIDRNSVGPGEAQQILVMGFDPFLPEANLRHNFSAYGSVASVTNKTDPDTGSFLGIASIKYRDTILDGQEYTAVEAVKRAESEFNGQRIGVHTVRVESDREGRKFKRAVEAALKKARAERARDRPAPPPPPPAETGRPASDSPAPPPNAPKGPSGRPSRAAPAASGASGRSKEAAPLPHPKSAAAALIEDELILGKIKRKPYIHIPHASVPVLGTTIPHLKKRLKAYDWREVRLDRTGYYIVFEDSKRGEDETERCYNECNMQALFTYKMGMDCQKYGNPNYERSPSPERVMAAKQKREHFERLQKEEAEDLEIEKRNRAENLDPVLGALEQLRMELRDKIMSDIKARVAIPIFHDSLDPAKHAEKRRKLGLRDPQDNEKKGAAMLFSRVGDTPPHTPRGRHGHPLSHSRPLRPHDPHHQRGRRGERERERAPVNAFVDERRRRPAPRPAQARGLHYRLQQMYEDDEDSDEEERRTSVTRDTDDQESRPLSRASRTSTPFDTDSVAGTPKHKRRKVADWEEEEKEIFEPLQKQLLGHLLHKEPEDLATRELELVVNSLPRTSKYASRARTELYIRQRSKADDDLFQVQAEKGDITDAFADDITAEKEQATTAAELEAKAAKDKSKKKRKTKKQILEEQQALKVEAQTANDAHKPVASETVAKIQAKAREYEEVAALEEKPTGWWSFTHDKPRRTIEDDLTTVLDIDGWQELIKDDEDLDMLRRALAEQTSFDIGDAKLWAWKQKEIKALNSGTHGPVQSETGIEGYYVPNKTGSARTEGVKKILNEEKSKYLPHRIKVQKAREERQAQAKANPGAAAAAEVAKMAAADKVASTATSRSNRVNNRRLINDINLQKQSLATSNSDADVAIRFNQLKKRKKLVKFDRSAIHGWGLYAEENIAQNELIIEYVGEKVRQKVADLREIKYEKQGVGSSYLFRMMDDEIVDATKKGGIARFINHSCNPNCTAKIIKVEGTPRIVIYALKDIYTNDELTYDYKFEREYGSTDRIKGLGEAKTYDGSSLRIGIVHARWNTKIIDALLAGTRQSLKAAGVKDENIVVQSVPGSYELPYAVQQMWKASHSQASVSGSAGALLGSATDLLSQSTTDLTKVGKEAESGGGAGSKEPFDAIIAVGALIKGSTMHFEYISDAVSHALMRVQLEMGVPVVFGLLTLLTEEQGLERAGIDAAGKGHNHGLDWGSAAVELGCKRRGWGRGEFVD